MNTPDHSLSNQSSQSSFPPSPSSSTSSLASPTIFESEEPSSAKKNVDFELPSIPEGKSEGSTENDTDFLERLRKRRMDAKGLKPNTADADISTVKGSGLSGAPSSTVKSYSRTTFQRESDPLSQSSPSLSSLRRPLTPPRVEPLPQMTPTPTLTPSGQGTIEEESDDSSSDKYSTPPMTAEHPATTTVSGGHAPQDTPTLVAPGDDTSEHDPVLEEFRRRRRELKQQREQSGKKSNASDSPPTTTETKTEAEERVETLPPSVGPTQLSTATNSSQYSGGGDESRQTSTIGANSSTFTGVYCPKCHCKVLLGQKYCSYCGEAVYMLFTNRKPPPTGSPTTRSTANGSVANVPTYQDRSKAPNYNKGMDTSDYYGGASSQHGGGQVRSDPHYRPECNVPTLPHKPGPRSPSKVAAAAEQSFLYDSSGRPMRASIPPEDDAAAKQPPPLPPSSYHQQHQAAGQQHQLQKPLRARVDDNQSSTAYGQYHSEKAGGSSQEAAAGGGMASAGASGYTPSPPVGAGILQYSEKLKRFREFLHTKGKSDTEIDNDPDYILMVEEERKKQPKGSVPSYGNASGYSSTTAGAPGRPNAPTVSAKVDRYGGQQPGGLSAHKPNVSEYDRVNLLASDNYSSENQRAMEKLKCDGQQLLDWIKVNLCFCCFVFI